MKKSIRVILLVILRFFSVINKFVYKKNTQILFFTNIECFNDNNIALFEYLCKNNFQKKYVIFYSTPDYKKMRTIYPKVKNIHFISPNCATLIFLSSKYVFYDAGTIKIVPARRQVVVSMWHGTPLKKIGRKAELEHSVKMDSFSDFSFIITTSKEFIPIFAESFECPESLVRVMGYPRNDYLFTEKDNTIFQVLNVKIDQKMVIWMPTFRQSKNGNYHNSSTNIDYFKLPLFNDLKDLLQLDQHCKENRIGLVIKLHPHSVLNNYVNNLPEFKNITVITNYMLYERMIQNYKFLSQFDALITDYSSVYFDYMLLNRPIYFTVDDFEDYKDSRGFSFSNPLEWMPGEIITDKEHFYSALETITKDKDNYKQQKDILCKRIHSTTTAGNACRNMLAFVGIK